MDNAEKNRLTTLDLYQILDTESEKVFDDLTLLAANICQTPISLISLVDEDRQWFKSKYGLEASETPREQAFCAHAIWQEKVLVVENALDDERFQKNPLVLGEPNIRFYAGAPLVMSNGQSLGTLCVIDRKPRKLTADQYEALETLRNAVVSQIELSRALRDLRELNKLVPMCAWCRKVKTGVDSSEWLSLETYVAKTTPITHGMCPECKEAALHERQKIKSQD